MDIDLNLLKCFEVVAVKGGISAASTALHLSQPAISLQIKRLEEQVGKKLFDRHNRGLLLTTFGIRFLEKARRILEAQNELRSMVNEIEDEPSGPLKIGTYTTASSYILAETASQFLKDYPKVTIRYIYRESRTILEDLKELRLDCAVLTDVPADPALEVKNFFKDELVFAVSAKRKSSLPKQIQPKELSQFPFLSYPLRYDLCYRTVEARFGSYLSKSRVSVETESFDTIKQMLIRNAGATFIPKYLIAKEVERGELACISVGNVRLPITFAFVTKRKSDSSLATQKFGNALFKAF